ncbi:hypothetical protein CF336_g4863 [Tilletia laevis]|uniref:Uncharacterized protein n=1 Tax=Tilletia caries TaxID=13290 RepID=A0A8T8TCW3_9BASI|nr:hypothetical protein CF336_g4863 [Tilletia laevis]KAE8259340.1 hypothetical protein A4X03_0g4114 [Tilletia caries]
MSQVSTTTSTYFLTKFARQDSNPHAPEQGLTWSFFDKPSLILKLFRTTTAPGPYHEALAKLGAARLGQPHPSSMRLEVEWQVENIGSSQTQGGESPYTPICLQNLDFDAQARMLTGTTPRSDLPLKATFQDDMVGFRFIDTTLQAGTSFDLILATPAPDKIAPTAVHRDEPAEISQAEGQAPVVEAALPPMSNAPKALPPTTDAIEELQNDDRTLVQRDDRSKASDGADSRAHDRTILPRPADTKPKTKGKTKATKQASTQPDTQQRSAQGSSTADAEKTKSSNPAAKPRAKAKPPAKQLVEAGCQTDALQAPPDTVETTSERIQAPPHRIDATTLNGNADALATHAEVGTSTNAQPANTTPQQVAAYELDLPTTEEARARLRWLSGGEMLAALQELMESPWRHLAIERLPTTFLNLE